MGRRAGSSGEGLSGVFRNAGLLLGGKTANAVLSLGALAVAARALGAETLGLLVLVQAFTQGIGEIAKFQSWQAIIRYGAPAREACDGGALRHLVRLTAGLDAVSAVLGTALCAALAGMVGPCLGWPEGLIGPAVLYSTSVVFMVTATPTGVLRLLGRFDVLAVNAALGSLIRLAGGLVVWGLGGGIAGFLIAWYLATMLPGLFLIGATWRTLSREGLTEGIGRKPRARPSEAFPGFWPFVWKTNANTTVELAFSHLGVLAVGWLLGPAAAGVFRVAKQVADGVAKPARLLVPAIYPEIGRLRSRGEGAALVGLMTRAALIGGAVATASLAGIVLFGETILTLIGGPGFGEGYGVMIWLVAAGVIGVWVFPVEPYLITVGRAGSVLSIRLLSAALYLPALFWALTEAGLIGAGWTRFGAALLMAALLLLRAAGPSGARRGAP
jgi:O-antigen/teichoic acid export membrane protein